MEQTVRQLQGDIPLEQQIIRNKIRSADKIQDHFSEQILERTQRVIFNIEIGGKLPAENLRAVFSIPVKCGRMKGFYTVIPGICLLYTSALHDLPISEYIGDHLSFFRCRNLVLFLLLYRKVQGSIRQRQSAKEAYQGASVWGGRIFARYLRVFNS